MASFYQPTSPNGANEGDVWVNQTTGEARVLQGGVWRAQQAVLAGDTPVTAGGALAVDIGSPGSAAPNIYFGSGVPTVVAPKGSLYLRTDGSSTSTRLYVATDAVGGWTAVTTAT
jgi:hypothetical protein